MQGLLTKLNFTVPIQELKDYYDILKTQYQHLNWNWNKCENQIVDQWKKEISKDPANLLTNGWAIQSNLVDLSIPCPPWNISIHETTDYRNTELSFGIISQLQKSIPFGYRWSISVQPPGGKVTLHSDQDDEYTVWIPIITNQYDSITFVKNDLETGYSLSSDGSAYLLNTTVPHYTYNQGTETRATVIFRLNQKYEKELLEIFEI